MTFSKVLAILNKSLILGEKKYSDGARSIGHVPFRGSEAYLHSIFSPLDSKKIDRIEEYFRHPLPAQYKEFLAVTNGINIFGQLSLYGLRTDYNRENSKILQPYNIQTPNVDERTADAKDSFIFIGGYGFDGSQLYIDNDTGKTFHCERYHAMRILHEWPDFWTMLLSETERLAILFDEHGRRIISKMTNEERASYERLEEARKRAIAKA